MLLAPPLAVAPAADVAGSATAVFADAGTAGSAAPGAVSATASAVGPNVRSSNAGTSHVNAPSLLALLRDRDPPLRTYTRDKHTGEPLPAYSAAAVPRCDKRAAVQQAMRHLVSSIAAAAYTLCVGDVGPPPAELFPVASSVRNLHRNAVTQSVHDAMFIPGGD